MDSIRRRRLGLTLIFASVPVQAAMTAGVFALALHAGSASPGLEVRPMPAQGVVLPQEGLYSPSSAVASCPAGTVGAAQIANNFNPGSAPPGTAYAIVEVPVAGPNGAVAWDRYLCTTLTQP